MDKLLQLLQKHDVRATCFVLGSVAERHPGLVKEISDAGHEIASHGFSHLEIYKQTPSEFRDDISRTNDILSSVTNEAIIGYRAPFFSITKESLWSLDILCELGFKYDSSINPIHHHRCGIPNADRTASILRLKQGRILEIPVASMPMFNTNLPVGGGTYMRIYPYLFWRWCLRRLENSGETFGIYTHPWEMDEDAPRIKVPMSLKISHYFNLSSTHPKLDSLFSDFKFGAYRDVYKQELDLVTQ